LLLEGVETYGRSPVHTDAVEQKIITGTWQPPVEGQVLTLADGTEKAWHKITVNDEGWFSEKGRGGYIYATYISDGGKVMLLHTMGNSMTYVNGVPRVGSRYQYQDENGNWIFTDTPPVYDSEKVTKMEGMVDGVDGLRDLEKEMHETYHPKNDVDAAALATVTVTSSIGTGSGFLEAVLPGVRCPCGDFCRYRPKIGV